jgi:hypothetical protein
MQRLFVVTVTVTALSLVLSAPAAAENLSGRWELQSLLLGTR